jgi:sporulation protein YlmC with PRC-barrel domain
LFREVSALDFPHIGQVVLETPNVIVVFGEGDDRYDVIISEILSTKDTVLIGLPLYEIARRYKKSREAALPVPRLERTPKKVERSNSYKLHARSLVGRKVKSRDGQFVGHVITDAEKSIVVFGHHHYRFDIPKAKIQQIGKDVILTQGYEAVFAYSKPRAASVHKVSV